jgi:type I restriction enzyme, S subunit
MVEGYKHTEIGVIPDDWELVSYENAFRFMSTASYSKAELVSYSEYKYIHYGVIHTDLKHFLDFNIYNPKCIRRKQLLSYSLIKEGDVIMADASEDYSGVGESVEVKNIKNIVAISGLHTFLLRDKGFFKNGFKGYIHTNFIVKSQLIRLATGLKVYGITKGNLKLVQIPLPPLPEQKAIAAVLSDTDELIHTLEKCISKKRNIKQGAMQKLLTPKEGWETKKLGEIAEITSAGVDKKINPNEIPVALLNYMDVYKRNYIFRNELNHFVTAPFAKTISCNVKKGDIFLLPSSETRTDIGTCAISMEDMQGVVYSYHILRLRYQIDIGELFGMYILKTQSFLNQSEMLCEGSGKRYVVSMNKFRSMDISYPKSIQEQNRIATILSDMDKEIEQLEDKLDKYKNVKQGLMQQLLTGKIRLI